MKRCDPNEDQVQQRQQRAWRRQDKPTTSTRLNPSRRTDDNPPPRSTTTTTTTMAACDNLPGVSGGLRHTTRGDEGPPPPKTIRDGGGGNNQAELGQFVLTVDFAPPPAAFISQQRKFAPSPTPTGEPLFDGGGTLAISPHQSQQQQQLFRAANTNSHLIEVSVCIRSTSGREQSDDTGGGAELKDRDQQLAGSRPKRRLVFERLDRIVLEMDNLAGVGETGGASGPVPSPFSPGPGDFQANVRLPLKSGLFDACLCFNLLNIRVASSRLLMLEQLFELENQCCHEGGLDSQPQAADQQQRLPDETRQELERDWLKMERLTRELRSALLAELTRVVHKNGKIMVSVFAYECCANTGAGAQAPGELGNDNHDGDCGDQDDNKMGVRVGRRRSQSDLAKKHRRPCEEKRAGPAGGCESESSSDDNDDDDKHHDRDYDQQDTTTTTTTGKHFHEETGPDCGAASERQADKRTHQNTGEVDSCCPRCRLESSERKRFRALDGHKFNRPKGKRSRQDERSGRQEQDQQYDDSTVTRLDLTITSDEPTNNEHNSEGLQKCQPMEGESGDMTLANNYLSADPTSAYFNKDEYTKRHRQSIAVQTFFTKSIEVHGDDDDDQLEVMALHHDQEPMATSICSREVNKQLQEQRDEQTPDEASMMRQQHRMDSYNEVGNKQAAISNQRTISMDTPVMRDYESFDGCSFNQFLTHDEDDQTMTTNEDSTTSGWTAPTSTALESSGERFGGTGLANFWHDNLASSSPTSNRPVTSSDRRNRASAYSQQFHLRQHGRRTMTTALETLDPTSFGQPASFDSQHVPPQPPPPLNPLDLEAHARNRSFTISSDNMPVQGSRLAQQSWQVQQSSKDRHLSTGTSNELDLLTSDDVMIDRANSGDFSSFTLGNTSTTTTSNRTRPGGGGGDDGPGGARNVPLPVQQRSANQIHNILDQQQQSRSLADQRRAFSETEAGNDELIGSLLEPGIHSPRMDDELAPPKTANLGQGRTDWKLATFGDRPFHTLPGNGPSAHIATTTSQQLTCQAKSTDPSDNKAADAESAEQGQPGSQVTQVGTNRANLPMLNQQQAPYRSSDHSRATTTSSVTTTTSSGARQLSRSKLLSGVGGAVSQAFTPKTSTSSDPMVKSAPAGRAEAASTTGLSTQAGGGSGIGNRHLQQQQHQRGSIGGQLPYQHLDESSNYNHHQSPPGAPPSSQQNQASDPGLVGPAPTPYTGSHISSAASRAVLPAHSSSPYQFGAAHSSAVSSQPPLPPTARHAQHHQWRQSNTFSSSLNSDISTSGGPNTKDTTEKDSSRRTSTLSGISSIYQQETSLGLGTPQSSYACSNSTPANTSQGAGSNSASGANCSNMGSIPELATFEHSINQQRDQQQQHGVSLGPGNDVVGGSLNSAAANVDVSDVHGNLRAANETTTATTPHVTSKFNRNRLDSLVEGRSFNRSRDVCAPTTTSAPHYRASTGDFRQNSRDQESSAGGPLSCDQSQVHLSSGSGRQQDTVETNDQSTSSASATNNIQRVALSLRSQLRERLSGMRPLSGFMNLNFDPSANSQAPPIQEEEASPWSPTRTTAGLSRPLGSGPPTPLGQRGDSTTPSGATAASTGGSLQDQRQRQTSFANSSPFNSLTAATTPTYRSSTSVSQRAADNQTPTSSATFKSFFRSTSSAAFNAFASSFQQQHPSNSSTPTATTVIAATAAGAYSSSSQNNSPALHQRFGSLSSSDVFDPPPLPPPPPPPLASSSPQIISLKRDSSQNQLTVSNKEQQSAGTGSPRSPLSPISVTSMRFFARIRDKFSLNNNNNNNSNNNNSGNQQMPQPQQASSQDPTLKDQNQETVDQLQDDNLDHGAQDTIETGQTDHQEHHRSFRDDSLRSCDLNDIVNPSAPERSPIPTTYDWHGQQQQQQPSSSHNRLISQYQQQQQWMDSCQQSMESSSSIRSLRSCWFSMPELFAMNNDGSSLQSPCGSQLIQLATVGGGGNQLPPANAGSHQIGHTTATMDDLLESLSHKLLVPACGFEPDNQQQVAPASSDQQQLIAGEQSGWASNQLFRQLTSQDAANQNWSINDLNLTSDDIAPAGIGGGQPVQYAQTLHQKVDHPEAMLAGQQQQPNLIKYSTLDDSICASMKSSSSAARPPQVASVEDTKQQQQQQAAAKHSPLLHGTVAAAPSDSRPVSQNSTISSTSCALSDLNSSDLQELNRSTSNSNISQHNISPLNNSPVSNASANEKQENDSAQKLSAQASQLLPAQQKQMRAMSLVPRTSPISPAETTDGRLGLSPSPSPLRPGSSTLTLPRSTGTFRRRSAAPGLAPGDDVPPAATTLDLRLGARKSRVRLTDLHPITFINDKEFLRSMSSLKNAPNNRLDAIFNSAVGRRLSINAEVAAQQQQEQQTLAGGPSKSSIKIGLTGYVYIDRPDSRLRSKEFQQSIRRPSLAPNFWRQNHRPSFMGTSNLAQNDSQVAATGHLFGGSHTDNRDGNLTLPGGAQSRGRSASFTPTMTAIADSETNQTHNIDPSKPATSRDDEACLKDPQKSVIDSTHQTPDDAGHMRRKTFDVEKVIGAPLSSNTQQKPPIIVAKSRSPVAAGSHRRRSVAGVGPHVSSLTPYHLDVRRRSMMLERLSESSIEVEAAAAAGGGGSSEKATTEPASGTADGAQDGGWKDSPQPKSPRMTTRPQSSPTARSSISPYQGKSPEPGSRQKPLIGPSTSVSSVSESSSSSDDDDDDDGTATSSNERADRDRHGERAGKGSRLAKGSGQQSDSSSSDDGDIDKLVAQYSVVGDHLSWSPSNPHRGLGHVRHAHLRDLDQQRHQQHHHQRAVKNDKILRQLMAANKVTAITSGGGGGAPASDARRFSAINLYQRDEDLFVANSMKRPPTSQIQILHALPQLANTLPVLVEKKLPGSGRVALSGINGLDNVQADHKPPTLTHNQLPVLPNKGSPLKSIITGTSGLTMAPPYDYGQRGSASNEMPLQSPTRAANAISSMDSMASVDVEEQLRRLRQQERRSQAAANAYHQNFNERELDEDDPAAATARAYDRNQQLSMDDSLKSCDLNDLIVPDDPTIPEILRPPVSVITAELSISNNVATTAKQNAIENQSHESNVSATAVSKEWPDETQRPLITPPTCVSQLIITCTAIVPQTSTTTTTTMASRLTEILPPALSYPAPSSGTKSCEPPFTKPLDTIIEGRGLLLGPEQDRAYANKLRRLSGHSHSNSRRASDVPPAEDDWCKCDADQPPVRKLSQVVADQRRRLSSVGSANTKSDNIGSSGTKNAPNSRKGESEQTAKNASENDGSKSMLNTVRNLARRTLVSFSTFSYSMDLSSDSADGQFSKKQPVVQTNSQSTIGKAKGPIEDEAAADGSDSSTSTSGADSHLDSGNEIGPGVGHSPCSSSSSMISLDDAENYRTKNKDNKMEHGRSMESSSSRSSSSTLSDGGEDLKRAAGDRNGPVGEQKEDNHDDEEDEKEEEEEEEEEVEDSEDDGDSETDVDEPKICYKCNKSIKMEVDPNGSRRNSARLRSSGLFLDGTTSLNNRLGWRSKAGHLLMRGTGGTSSMMTNFTPQDNHENTGISAQAKNTGDCDDDYEEDNDKHEPVAATKSAGPGGKHSRRRAQAARRSASMNAADHPSASGQQGQQSSGPVNRRKNKWHIQRNLAPKLKRQRSFSANYAPEVPNPMMPPPRRFSAAPTLTCPHRNKSSSHSSSSLHHAYSIDSSESMITVIPANRSGLDFLQLQKRQSRGSISCLSSQAQSPCNSTIDSQLPGLGAGQQSSMSISLNLAGQDQSGSSLYGLPRSPLSPRSPSRCSPIALTPNTSDAHALATSHTFSLEAPFSLASTSNTTINTTCSGMAMVQQQQHQHQQRTMRWISNSIFDPRQQQQQPNQISTNLPSSSSNSFQFNIGEPSESASIDLMDIHKPAHLRHLMLLGPDNSSLTAENGTTSFNSSRNELDEIGSVSSYGHEPEAFNYPQIATTPSGLLSPRLECSGAGVEHGARLVDVEQEQLGKQMADNLMLAPPAGSQQSHRGSTIATTYEMNSSIDPNRPIVCETINDFCARHSREELEFLVSQIEGLRITECYYSEKSSTLCMVIEVHHRGDIDGAGADFT